MMYRVLQDLTEVLDRDLQPQERTVLEHRLAEIHQNTDDPNIHELVDALTRYLDNKQLILSRHRPNFTQRLGERVFPLFSKFVTHERLKLFLIVSLGAMGVLAMFDFVRLLVVIPAPGPAIEAMIGPMVSHGQLRSAQEALWYIIRTAMEGFTGLMLIFSGGMISTGRERRGIELGTIALIIWITVINLLVYYFDQFGAVVVTLFQFFELTVLTYYRRAFLKLL
jgi:hypothetical protein